MKTNRPVINKFLKVIPLLVLGAVTAAHAQGPTLSLNYNEGVNTGVSAIDGGEVWGLVPTDQWANGSYYTGGLQASGVNVATFGGAGTTASYNGSPSVDNTGWKAGIRNFPATGNLARFDVDNLVQAYPVGYDVIVYITGFNADTYTPMTATTGGNALPTYYVDIDGPNDFAAQFQNYTQITSTSSASPTQSANYVRYSGLTADTFNFTLGQPVGGGQTAIGGFQIVPVPEPSTAGLMGLAVAGLLFVRRKVMA